jgi:predicted AlkP superfamily pyrophosphatase or phosphodiesterase
MVSFDAFRADYIDRYQPLALSSLAARGVRAQWMTPSFPSKTFPNHYTLATGLYPGHHGIVGNAFFDPSRRQWYRISQSVAVRDSSWYGGEPIWVTAEKNGVKTAAYFWSGSEAAIGGVRPTYWTVYDAKVPNDQRVNSVIAWLRKPASERPHLALLYFSEVDDTTHSKGPDAPNTAHAVADVDRALGALLDSIRALPIADSVNVVVVSDHGMVETSPSRLIDVSDVLHADTVGVEMSDNGPTLSLWFNGDSARATRAFNALRTKPHMQAYTRTTVPERWHTAGNSRVGDILLVADEGWIIEHSAKDRTPSTGAHGYDPALASMRATFVAAGPNVRNAGVIPAFENVNVYPFIAALLKLQRVPNVDGDLSVLRSVLR